MWLCELYLTKSVKEKKKNRKPAVRAPVPTH